MDKSKFILGVLVFFGGWLASTAFTSLDSFGSASKEISPLPLEFESVETKGASIREASETDGKMGMDEILERFNAIEEEFRSEEKKRADKEKNREKPSPHDWIPMENIRVYEDSVVILIDNPEWAMYADTNSMDPLIDSTTNAIEIVPKSENDIHVGDIVAYESEFFDGLISHRVVEISEDSDGWYAILKGDNNDSEDPGKIRFSQIKRVVVGIIY